MARKLTSADEEFWMVVDGEPEMPAELVLESLCQAGNWLIYLSSGGQRTGALLSIADVSYGRPVRPGETLMLQGQVDSIDDERAIFSGQALVGEEVVLEAREIMCALLAVERLEDPESLRRRADAVLQVRSRP